MNKSHHNDRNRFAIWGARFLLLLITAGFLPAQTPGQSDQIPPNKRLLFTDHEIATMTANSNNNQSLAPNIAVPDGTLAKTYYSGQLAPPSDQVLSDGFVGAAGHILQLDHEDFVYVSRSNNLVKVTIPGPKTNTMDLILGQSPLANRVEGCTDFMAVAVGDLDHVVDSQGATHDEIAVAYATPSSSDAYGIVLAVVSYDGSVVYGGSSGGINLNAIGLADKNDYGSNSPGVMLQSDNVVGVAVGDFDGDGANEIAVAYLKDGQTLDVALYRLIIDADGAKIILPVSETTSTSSHSWVASLSVGKGNFDGAGIDELVIGRPWYTLNCDTKCNDVSEVIVTIHLDLAKAGTTAQTVQSIASSGDSIATVTLPTSAQIGLVPAVVTMSGGTGKWAAINGSWPTTLADAHTFTMPVDVSSFGSYAGQNISIQLDTPLMLVGSGVDLNARDSTIYGTTQSVAIFHISDLGSHTRVQVAPGLFQYDPSNGFDLDRREVAVAWNAPDPGDHGRDFANFIFLGLLRVNPDATFTTMLANTITNGAFVEPSTNTFGYGKDNQWFRANQRFSLAAGAYKGNQASSISSQAPGGSSPDPTWSLAIAYQGAQYNEDGSIHENPPDPNYYGLVLATVALDSQGQNYVISLATPPTAVSPTTALGQPTHLVFPETYRVPVVSVDTDGDSLLLGPPIHIQVPGVIRTDFIIEEPPKHSAWIDLGDGNGPGVQTISRYDTFNLDLHDSQNNTLTSTSTQTQDWTIGGSVATSASATAKAEGSVFLVSAEASFTASVSDKLQFQSDENTSKSQNTYGSADLNVDQKTDHDDVLVYSYTSYDIWRYRIYGTSGAAAANNPNPYYELVVPSVVAGSDHTSIAGLGVDWYQPYHENGNILSYPTYSGAYVPPDLGTFGFNGATVSVPTAWAQYNGAFSGVSSTQAVSFTNTSGNSTAKTYSKTLSESADVSTTYSAKVTNNEGVDKESLELSFGVDLGFNNSNSWSSASDATNTTSETEGITLNLPSGPAQQAYDFSTALYNTPDGTLKAAHGVDVAGDGSSSFWLNTNPGGYGSLPDPALNLPNRFLPTYSSSSGNQISWAPYAGADRKKLRGFFVRSTDPTVENDPSTSAHPVLGSVPQAGDTVRLEVRVYNYSTVQPANNTVVNFYAIPVDTASTQEVCKGSDTVGYDGVCPSSSRIPIGSTNINSLQALQLTCSADAYAPSNCTQSPAYIDWTIPADLAGLTAVGIQNYRIYLTLNENPTVQELNGFDKPAVKITEVTWANNSSPNSIVITTDQPNPFTLSATGANIWISGVQGASFINGSRFVTRMDSTHFQIQNLLPTSDSCASNCTGMATDVNPGQNNEGWGEISIQAPAQTPTLLAARALVAAKPQQPRPHLAYGNDSLAARGLDGELYTKQLHAYLNQPLELRAKVYSDQTSPSHYSVQFFDSVRNSRRDLLADRTLQGIDANHAGHVWHRWIPRTLGTHRITLQVRGPDVTGVDAPEFATLEVDVVPDPAEAAKAAALSPATLTHSAPRACYSPSCQ